MLENKQYGLKKKLFIWLLLICFLATIIPVIMRSELLYARHLQVEGIISSIKWKSANHQLPEIILLNEFGNKVVISHSSVALNKIDIKVGDKFLKKKGDNHCWINGEKIKFSKYSGAGSITEVLKHYLQQIRN